MNMYIHKHGEPATRDETPTRSTVLQPINRYKLLWYSLPQKNKHATQFWAKWPEDEEK
jgi:hypothetical protein